VKEKAHILVVEDSATQAVKLKHLLAEHGYTVSVTVNGREALAFLKGEKPDLIISDIIMPFVDGYELCRTVRADITLSRIPVILLTALSDPGEVINGLQCGADNFITKPYKEQFILSRVAQVIANQQFRQSGVSERGIEIYFAGKTNYITSSRFQIVDLLLSTFENAIQNNLELDEINKELCAAQDALKKTNSELFQLNMELDDRVELRTKELKKKEEEIKIMSQQLWQSEKLATMGELSASIAHELNNPLTTISLRIEQLMMNAPPDAPDRHELEIIEQEVERMANLVSNLLQFSRRSQAQISTVDVCEEIDRTLDLIHYHLRKCQVEIIRDFGAGIPPVHADRQQLRQLFLNLFNNAGDAMPQGGRLTIRVKGVADSQSVSIEISDTGVGIPQEMLSQVMEPFYTTKPEGKGTGLGLAICKRIVNDHEGVMEIASEGIPVKGTTVCITLPVSNGRNVQYMT
jgi:signal transduction histidine kinase